MTPQESLSKSKDVCRDIPVTIFDGVLFIWFLGYLLAEVLY